jgi:hypothetical protein
MGAILEGSDAHVFCDDCGKDITVSNVYGMFCEDMCGYDESVKAKQEVDVMISGILERLG